ncbi:MAG: UDP-glucose 4-epimerase GalE [Spirochaetes bacterium]|nr:UDP-glucose 4-epimerase GalE [Spirochaetota bacterium]
MKEILVTGGAGYIGSHVVKMLAKRGFVPIVLDSLENGFADFVKGHELIMGDIGDYGLLTNIFRKRKIECVMNFASYIAVGESVEFPLKYYLNNVAKTCELFRAMIECNVKRFIFSSTAAVYGYPTRVPIDEESPLAPINPYGRTKFMIEQVLRDLDEAYGMKFIALRYFNAAGADPSGEIGESHTPETHLIPLVLRSILDDNYVLTVFGTDYNTPDGTCIRDYIHVNDLADAHVLALEKLLGKGESTVYNLGNGRGFTVMEVIQTVKRVTGKEPKVTNGPRRAGDPDVLVASSTKAMKELGWKPSMADLETIVETAWRWEKQRKRKGW